MTNDDFFSVTINLVMQNKIHILVHHSIYICDHTSFNILLHKLYENNVFDSYLVKSNVDSYFRKYGEGKGFAAGYDYEYQLKISNSHSDLEIAKDFISHLRNIGVNCTLNILN